MFFLVIIARSIPTQHSQTIERTDNVSPTPTEATTIIPSPSASIEETVKTYNYTSESSPDLKISFDYPAYAQINSDAREYNIAIDHILFLSTTEEVLIDINGTDSGKIEDELKFKMEEYYRIDPNDPTKPIKLNQNPNYEYEKLSIGVNKYESKYQQFRVDDTYLVTIFEFPRDQGMGSWYIYLSVNSLNPSSEHQLIFDSIRQN